MAKLNDNVTPPTNGGAQPTNGTAQPTNETAQPTNGTAQPTNETAPPQGRFPAKEVFGFLASIIMTLLAIIVAFRTNLPGGVIMAIIGGLALLQAGLQLTMFMHLTEGKDGRSNVINMLYSAFLAIVIVFGSIWILTSGHMAGH